MLVYSRYSYHPRNGSNMLLLLYNNFSFVHKTLTHEKIFFTSFSSPVGEMAFKYSLGTYCLMSLSDLGL